MKFLAGLLLLVPVSLSAANATVDCSGATPGAFTSINAAFASLDLVGPHTVTVLAPVCVENVVLSDHDRVTLQGSPAATINPAAGTGMVVLRSRSAILRNLTIRGTSRALAVQRKSDAVLTGVTLENAQTGLVLDEDSLAVAGGPNAVQAVLIRNNNLGVLLDNASMTLAGNVTIEDNALTGVEAEHSRILVNGTTVANFIRDNAGNGLFVTSGSNLEMRGANQVTGNGLGGVFAFTGSSADLTGTTVSGNVRGGVVYLFNSSGRVQSATITNNGTVGDPLSSGLTAGQNSSVLVSATTISGTNGPGLVADSGAMVRLGFTTVSGNTAEPIRAVTGAVLELQSGNTIPGSGDVVICDDSAVLFGDGADVKTSCRKTK